MTLMKHLLGASALLALTAGAALADPAIIYDVGGKNDKSFNEAAFGGAERWKAETGGTYKELEMQNEAQREQALRQLADDGANPIVMTGFAFGDVLNTVAPGLSGHQVCHHRHGGGSAQREIGGLHRGSGLVPGRHDGWHGVQIGCRGLCRRHGHSADPPFRLWLCAGCDGGQSGSQGDPEHDRHRWFRVEQPGEGRRDCQIAAEPGR